MKIRKILAVILTASLFASSVQIPAFADVLENEESTENVTDTASPSETGNTSEGASPSNAEYIEEEAPEEKTAENETKVGELPDTIVLTAEASDGVIVTMKAETSAFVSAKKASPSDAEEKSEKDEDADSSSGAIRVDEFDPALLSLTAEIIEEKKDEDAVDEALEAVEDKNVARRVTYDIKVLYDGREIQPVKEVKIEFSFKQELVPGGADAVTVYHHDADEGVKEIASEVIDDTSSAKINAESETEQEKEPETEEAVNVASVGTANTSASDTEEGDAVYDDGELIDDVTVSGVTDSFSLYTVDFTYDDMTVSIPGGSTDNKLADIISKLGIRENVVEAHAYADPENPEPITAGETESAVVVDGVTLFRIHKDEGEWYADAVNSFNTEHGLVIRTANDAEYMIRVTDDDTTETNVKYIDADGTEETCPSAIVVEASSAAVTWGKGESGTEYWYVVNKNVTISSPITCNGDVHLILKNGCTLTTNNDNEMQPRGICVSGDNNKFTVYAQSTDEDTMGSLNAYGGYDCSGIGSVISEGGNITINGGKITATGGNCGAGIGGGGNGSGSYITINGGIVKAKGGMCGAGIGGGSNPGSGSHITINGGTVTATGDGGGAGIGGGAESSGSYITINGGTVTATGDGGGAGIGGGAESSGSTNIKINISLAILAGTDSSSATPFENDGSDLTERLSGKPYVKTGKPYTVTFDANGHGANPSSQTIPEGGKVSKPVPPSESGYTFEGWYKDSECTTAWNFAGDTVTKNITLYAKWMEHPKEDCITFSSDGAFSLKSSAESQTWDGVLYYSTDKDTWTIWNGTEIDAAQAGSAGAYKLYLYGNSENTVISPNYQSWVLTSDAAVSCKGNIETLRGAAGGKPSATSMGNQCYAELFSNCTNLTTAPTLPATNLAESCYYDMFAGCTDLTKAPALPATNLANACYYGMFAGCTNLTEAPVLPAVNLQEDTYVYYNMFYNCTNLKIAETQEEGYVKWITTSQYADVEYYGYDYGMLDGTPVNTTKKNTTYYAKIHAHGSWKYSANGAVLTAECGNDGCTDPKYSVSIEINAPGMAYTGTAYDKASIDNGDTWKAAGIKLPTIVYYKQNETEALTKAPVAAGVYTAKITAGTATAAAEFTISRVALTVEGTSANGKTYDGTTKATIGTVGTLKGAIAGDDVSIASATGTFDTKDAGNEKTVTVTYTLKGEDAENYTVSDSTTFADIERAKVTVTADSKEKKYGETDPELTAAKTGLIGTDTVAYSLSRATGENVGTYTITSSGATVQGNYNVIYKTGTFTITKADGQITAPKAKSLTYNGSEQVLAEAGSSTTGTVKYSLSETGTYADTIPTGKAAGDYDVWYYAVGDSNHKDTVKAKMTVTIAREGIAVPSAETGLVYDGRVKTGVKSGIGYTLTGNTQTNAGSYTATATLDDNHKWSSGSTDPAEINWSIARATYDMSGVSFADKEVQYDGTAKSLTITGTLPNGVTVSYEGNGKTEAGVYTVTAKFAGDYENYERISDKTAKLTITALAKYKITYDLNGGKWIKGSENPTEYTEKSDFTLKAPERDGYVFIGWEGTELEKPETIVVIEKGSKGDRSYKANWNQGEEKKIAGRTVEVTGKIVAPETALTDEKAKDISNSSANITNFSSDHVEEALLEQLAESFPRAKTFAFGITVELTALEESKQSASTSTKVTYDATPYIQAIDTDGTVNKKIAVSNDDLNGKSVNLHLAVPKDTKATSADIKHTSSGRASETYTSKIYTDESDEKYVEVSITHFSTFEITLKESGSDPKPRSSGSSSEITAAWIKDAKGWKYRLSGGGYARNGWYEIDNPYASGTQERKSWFHFGTDGYMQTGWFTDKDNKKYYLHPGSDGTQGRMYHGKQKIDGKEYEFSEVHDGYFGHLIETGARKTTK